MLSKTIRDAVHGDMTFTEAELRLVDIAVFQRLRGIKQLGTSHLVYPSATHTRFEHSLGTCWMAKRILRAVEEDGTSPPVAEDLKELVAIGALLHDITHVPYGHTFEDERRVLERHDESEERLQHFLSAVSHAAVLPDGSSVRAVLLAGSKAGLSPFVREIISGTVCADLLDYLKRDAYHCGLPQQYDERLFRYFRIVDEHLVLDLQQHGLFRPDALSELVNLLRLRYNLTERVYYHHAKVASGAMVSKAVEVALNRRCLCPEELLNLRDDSFLFLLRQQGADVTPVREILDDLAARQLYVRAYLLTPDQPNQPGLTEEEEKELERRFHFNERGERERSESEIERRLSLPEGSVLIYCPSTRMALKEAEMLVRLQNGNIIPLSQMKVPEVEVLADKHRKLWRFYVFLRRRHADLVARCAQVCEEIIGYANMLPAKPEAR